MRTHAIEFFPLGFLISMYLVHRIRPIFLKILPPPEVGKNILAPLLNPSDPGGECNIYRTSPGSYLVVSHLRTTEVNSLLKARQFLAIQNCHPVPAHPYLMSCLLYTSPSPRDQRGSRMPSSA